MVSNSYRTLLNDLCADAVSGKWSSEGSKVRVTSSSLKELQGEDGLPNQYTLAEVVIDKDLDCMVATELDFVPSSIAATARLMAEARTAIPELLAYIDELEQKLGAAS